jgi:3-hydroxyisobutyrate dehydrogenase
MSIFYPTLETPVVPLPRIGFIGLGVMGRPMAINLVNAGYTVTAFDINPSAVAALMEAGADSAPTAADVAWRSDIFITMVVNDAQFKAILFGPGNAAASLPRGATVIGMSTMSRATVIETAAKLAEMGLHYVDAPVSGGEVGAQSAQLSIMVGAPPDRFEACKPVLEAMGSRVYHVGEKAGDGQAVKMINQLLVCIHNAAAAEALTLADKLGLDVPQVFDIVTNSAGNSWILGNRGPRMLSKSFTQPKSALHILIKDLGFVVDAADALGHPLPLGSAAHQLYKMAGAMGMRDLDDSVMIEAMARISTSER